MRTWMTLLLVVALAVSLGACATQDTHPASSSSFGPPRIMSGNQFNTGFHPTPGLTAYKIPYKQDIDSTGTHSGSILPSGWHGFGGS